MLRTVRQMHAKVDGLPELVSESVLKLELANGSPAYWHCLEASRAKHSRTWLVRRLIIVDEASRVEDELFAVVRPMLATRSDGQFWML